MTDLPTGAQAPGTTSADQPGKAKQVAERGTQAAGEAVADVKDTAAQQTQRVAAEVKTQTRNVATDVRDKLGEQARAQNDRLVGTIRQTADQLDEMRGERADSPAAAVVSRVADGGRQLADYLDRHGPEGVLREVQDFARRRPGAFLATALAAGFVVGRLGKSVAKADSGASGAGKPTGDAYTTSYPAGAGSTATEYTGTGYAGTEYAGTGTQYTGEAATGIGTPAVLVEDEYPPARPETRP